MTVIFDYNINMKQINSFQAVLFVLAGLVSGFILSSLSLTNNAHLLSGRLLPIAYVNNFDARNIISGSSRETESSEETNTEDMIHRDIDKMDRFSYEQGWRPAKLDMDHIHHDDDDSVAKYLFDKIRVLVFVETYPDNLDTKAEHVRNTWGKRANKLLFASDSHNESFPTINITVEFGRYHLTAKTMKAFDYCYDNHYHDFDWFMKADDDTYVIMENLRYFLSNEDPNDPVFFGHWFKSRVKQGYHSGGGGYVLSKEALRRFGERNRSLCFDDGGPEDVRMGQCMQAVNVSIKSSLDNLGRSRFHALGAKTMLKGSFPGWYRNYDKYGGTLWGKDRLSDYAISFHYCTAQVMDDLEYYVYHLRPFGIHSGLQNLNVNKSADVNRDSEIFDTDSRKSSPQPKDKLKAL